MWKSSVASVDRGPHNVVVELQDGRKLAAPVLAAARKELHHCDRPIEVGLLDLDARERRAVREHLNEVRMATSAEQQLEIDDAARGDVAGEDQG